MKQICPSCKYDCCKRCIVLFRVIAYFFHYLESYYAVVNILFCCDGKSEEWLFNNCLRCTERIANYPLLGRPDLISKWWATQQCSCLCVFLHTQKLVLMYITGLSMSRVCYYVGKHALGVTLPTVGGSFTMVTLFMILPITCYLL